MVVKKNVESSKPRAVNNKNKHVTNKKKVLLVAQEISFAKVLAGNDQKLRDRGVKRLRKWLIARSKSNCDLKKDDFSRLWKGLYYCMWMADKPLFQEDLAETLSSLVHCFEHPSSAVQFMEGFFRTMAQEWKGIDQHRFDKFLMLIRRFLRQCLVFVEQKEWNLDIAEQVSMAFQRTLLPNHEIQAEVPPPSGLVMHFTDIFLEELAKVSEGDIDEKVFLCFLNPFTLHLATVKDGCLRSTIQHNIFNRLLNQTPVALEHEEKFAAWSQMGFPGGTIDVMQRAEDGDDDDDDDDVEEEEDEDEEEEDEDEEEEDDNKEEENEGEEDTENEDEDVDEEDDEESDEDDELIQNAVNGHNVLDPRAGGVDVELPLLNFEPQWVLNHLKEHRFKKYTNSKSRKCLAILIKRFEKIAQNEYPLGIKRVPTAAKPNLRRLRIKASEDLDKFERQLLEEEAEDAADMNFGGSDDDEDSEDNDSEEEDSDEKVELSTDKKSSKKPVKDLKRKKSQLRKGSLKTHSISEDASEDADGDAQNSLQTVKNPSKKLKNDLKRKKFEAQKKVLNSSKLNQGDDDSDGDLEEPPKKLKRDLVKRGSEMKKNKKSEESPKTKATDNAVNESSPSGNKKQQLTNLKSPGKTNLTNGKSPMRSPKTKVADSVPANESSPGGTKKQQLAALKSPGKTKLTNGKSPAKSEEDVEVEKLSRIQIAPSDSTEGRIPSDLAANSGDVTQSGTHALLQHLAPHVVGSKKLKRRASCDAKLQTTPVIKGVKNVKDDSVSSPKSEGKKSKRKSLGWDEPLQEGEYEIVIPREKIVGQKKRLSDANNATSSKTPKLNMKNPFSTPISGKKLQTPGSSSKKVNFIPERNMAQSESEYFRTLRENPEIPYDANRDPPRGVLKPSPYSSPVNPFYKRKLKI